MPSSGTQFGNRIFAHGSDDTRGLAFLQEANAPDSCEFIRWSGTIEIPDLVANSGTRILVPAAPPVPAAGSKGVPRGMRCYVTSYQIAVTTAFSGGTAGNVSLSLQGTDGTVISTATGTALSVAGTYFSVPGNTLPSGVVDNLLAAMGPSTAVNQGLQVVLGNSTAGVARIRVRGYYAP